MEKNSVQQHLDKGMYGTPKLKPEEQQKYLGTFRERVILALTIPETQEQRHKAYLKKTMQTHSGHTLLINANIQQTAQDSLIAIATEAGTMFRVLDTDASNQETMGAVYAADTAVDVKNITVPEQAASPAVSPPPADTQETPKKKSFWSRIFF